MSDIEDWAIEAAKDDLGFNWPTEQVKAARKGTSNRVVQAILVLARMIQKHEPHRKPVDPDTKVVSEVLLAWGINAHDQEWHDDRFQAALAAYKAAKL